MEQPHLDGLLDLEENYYNEGYRLGIDDGARTGRIEGRIFGLQKGFGKYVELGQISGNAAVWQARLPLAKTQIETLPTDAPMNNSLVPDLPSNPKLERHLKTLLSLVDPQTVDTQNTELAVSHFEDRLRSATTKAKIIENTTATEPSFDQPSPAKIEVRPPGQRNPIDMSEQAPGEHQALSKGEWF